MKALCHLLLYHTEMVGDEFKMRRLDGIKIAKNIAKQRDGRHLGGEYKDNSSKLQWECNVCNYQWKASLTSVKDGNTWCPICSDKIRANTRKLENGLGVAYKIANKKGGKCLSKEYINNHTKMIWQCKKKHIWRAHLGSIKNNKWCPACANVKPLTMKIVKEVAKKRNGVCLSTDYINNALPLLWKCNEKHKWKASLDSVKNGNTWCPECAQRKRSKSANNSYILHHWKTGEELVCQASWEKKVVEYLNKNKINFRWQPRSFNMPDGKKYYPDMYLHSTKKWVEIKGYFRKDAKEKWDWFKTIKPNSELWNKQKLQSMGIL